jgi:hypothetical protein
MAVIVEGCSDRKFLDDYLKKHYDTSLRFKTVMSKANCNGGCEILNFKTISKKISTLILDDRREKIFVLIDFKTQCNRRVTPNCITELKTMYNNGLKKALNNNALFSKVEILVVDREIEAWMVSKWSVSNNRSLNYNTELKKYVGNKEKEEAVNAFIYKCLSDRIHVNLDNNKSLERFISKVQECL